MMKVFVGLLFALAVCTSVNAATLKNYEPDGPVGRNYMADNIRNLLLKGNYGLLDKTADTYRTKKERTPNGWWKLVGFYYGFKLDEKASKKDWDNLFASLNKWASKYPDSVTAKVALATAWFEYSSKARGTAYADNVSKDSWAQFKERLQMAKRSIEGTKNDSKYPDLLLMKLKLEGHLGHSRKDYYDLFYRAIAAEPTYHELYSEAFRYAQKKWGGEPGEWFKLLERINTIAPKNEAIFARVAFGSYQNEWFKFDNNQTNLSRPSSSIEAERDLDKFKQSLDKNLTQKDPYRNKKLSWNMMKLSLDALPKNSPYNDNLIALYSCLADDTKMSKTQWEKIGNAPYITAWDSWGFDPIQCRNKSGLPKIDHFTDSIDYRYLKELAGKGSGWAKGVFENAIKAESPGFPKK